MARTETDRDDLFAEAVAMPRRAEFVAPDLPNEQSPIVAGVHRNGRVSVYCGGAVADHLDAAGRLTRAFRTGDAGAPLLYRSQGETLAELIRVRSAAGTSLVRRDLSAGELRTFLAAARDRLRALGRALRAGDEALLRVTDEDPRVELAAALAAALPADAPLAPRFKGKR